ncbi:hypothetical protein [Nitrosopumilus sp.]|uniref:hypothetical protein n=1 Tax=Nitrosopumilus sp. TaxID=2024843 RepID=UPI003D09808D
MNKLRILSIISTVIIIVVFFGTGEIYKEQIEEDAQKANLDNPFLPYAGLFLFGIPLSVAGIIASFLKTTKSKIIVSCSIIGVSYIVIFIIAFLMLEYPAMFGIPETYWD